MPYFTCITTIRDCIWLKQFETVEVERALREAVAALPHDDGAGPFDDELEWLHSVASGQTVVTMQPLGHCKNTWVWREGLAYEPQYITYVVKTDATP